MTRPRLSLLRWTPVLAVVLLAPARGFAKGSLDDVEREFREAIGKVTPATVICVPRGVESERASSSSGVIVSRSGLVLSDGDVGAVLGPKGRGLDHLSEDVEIRVPDLEKGGFSSYPAVVVRRERGSDTCLLRVTQPPPGGFPFALPPAGSDHLKVGDFLFVTGNAFGLSEETPPALTAGIVSALTYLPPGDGGGRLEYVYTSAAVNPGVNGGPVVDVEGRLVGTVSTWMLPTPTEPYQFLGKVLPIDRIRAIYSDLPETKIAFTAVAATPARATGAAKLERVLRSAAAKAYPWVVSLEVTRATPLSTKSPGDRSLADTARWQGPVSGVLVSGDGFIVTSLYNLTNVTELVLPGAELPPEMQVESGLRAVTKVTAHLGGGLDVPAKLVAHDGRLGIALLQADLAGKDDGGRTAPGLSVPDVAPADAFQPGRFVLALGNPFGKDRLPDPLLTFGVLSKVHADDVPSAWRGQWQTDAGVTDANVGGALVDVRGRVLGVLQLWMPLRQGRNSGIGFVVPWPSVVAALPRLEAGRSLRRGRLGIRLAAGDGPPAIDEVTPGSAAEHAGLRAQDVIVGVDGRPITDARSGAELLTGRWEGEHLKLRVRRGSDEIDVEADLDPVDPGH